MSAFDCYREYCALKRHFGSASYDYFKFNGKLKLNYSSFEKRRDKIFFEKLSKHEDPKGLLVSNLVDNAKLWIRDIAYGDPAQRKFREWQRRQQALTYTFKQELSLLEPEFDSNFTTQPGSHPYLMRLYLGGRLSLETLIMLVDLAKCMRYWGKSMEYDPIAEDVMMKIVKYRPFLRYEHEKVKEIVVDKFS